MIIDAGTILLTLASVLVFLYGGLQLIRGFALQIARENHDAVVAMDTKAEEERLRRERSADAAAAAAFAKVQPILTTGKSGSATAASSVKTAGTLRTSPTGTGGGAPRDEEIV